MVKVVFRKVLKKHKMLFYFFLLSSFLNSFLSSISPYISSKIIDGLVNKTEESVIKVLVFQLITIGIIIIILNVIIESLNLILNTKISYKMNTLIISEIHNMPLSKVEYYEPLYLTQRINSDCKSITSFKLNIIQNIIIRISIIIISLIILLYCGYVYIYILLVCLVIYFITITIFKKRIYKTSMIIKEVQDQFMVKLNNLIVNNKIVKIENISKNLIENLNHFFKELFFNSFKFSFLNSNVNALDNLISLLAQGILYIVSIKKILDNEITIGQLTIIITYFNLILNSIKYLFSTIKSYQNIKVCYDRVNELMLISKEKFGNIRPSSISSIQLKNISFCYQEKLVISNFSYTFRKNNIYCIKGKNGSGKTTLIKILLGLYSDIYEGEVLYNENNIIKNDLCYLRLNNISYLDQNIDSYNYLDIKTVNENGCLEETFDNLKNSNSKNVYVSKNGKNITDIATLSRGEKQKKLIIQALAKKADVIILDEPTAALDLESKVAFLKLITSIKANKIIILISHDEEIIRIADYTINSLEFNTIIEPS